MGEMTWEALATFFTGILAVASATVVAIKQGHIVKRQTLLQELALRNELFDKRMGAYRAIRQYIALIMHAVKSEQFTLDDFVIYNAAMEDARFLFSKRLYLELNALDMLVFETRQSIEYHEWDNHDPKERLEALADAERRQAELRRRYHALPVLFDTEMNIRTADESLSDYVADVQLPDVPDEFPPSNKVQPTRGSKAAARVKKWLHLS